MRYIIQLNTGSFCRSMLKAEEVIETLERCLKLLKVEKLIFGWAPDMELNRKICGFLEKYLIEKYLWLPVFAEIQDFEKTRKNQNIAVKEDIDFNACEEDAFEFACQSDNRAIDRAVEVFEQLTQGCQVEGVFLDRIRYASLATSPGSIYGCWCPQCRKGYIEKGIDTERIQDLAKKNSLKEFLPEKQCHGVYHFSNPDIDKLMEVKRETINRQVGRLCQIFRSRGLKIGVDTFAPTIADFVGQDLETLGKQADFMKPMVYLRTDAPAGLPFELRGMGEALQERLRELWGGSLDDMAQIAAQMKALKGKRITVTPGIDVNAIEGICTADKEYVKTFLNYLRDAGCDTVVLSWNIMKISREMIEELAALQE